MDFVVLEWFSNDFQTISSKVITDNRSKGDNEAIRIPSIVWQLAQSLGKYCICKVVLVLVLGLLVIGWKIGTRFLTQIIKCSNCNHNYFQLSFETPKTGFAAVGLVASLLKPSLCFFFSDVSPVLLPSICNLMWLIWANCLILLSLNARKSQGKKKFHRLHVDPLSY